MLKRILLGLDDTPASLSARDFALRLAKQRGAALTGLAIVDADRIAPAEGVPLGAESYKHHKDTVLIARARADMAAMAQRFGQECAHAGVGSLEKVTEQDAVEALLAESDLNDLIVLGRDAAFHTGDKPLSGIVETLARRNPRPLVIASERPVDLRTVLVGYDGSIPAMRALQMFCLLDLAPIGTVTVVSIADNIDVARYLSSRAAEYLGGCGMKVEARPLQTDANVADVLCTTAAEIDAGMVVLGAFGKRGWREFLLGSTAERLVTKLDRALFIHH